jgi:hypothetical protein
MRVCDFCGEVTNTIHCFCEPCAKMINNTVSDFRNVELIEDSLERSQWDSPTNHKISPDPEYID